MRVPLILSLAAALVFMPCGATAGTQAVTGVCAEYFARWTEAHDRLVVRDDQSVRVADIHDPFEVAAAGRRGSEPLVPVAAPTSSDVFRREFEALLTQLSVANFEEATRAFTAKWSLTQRQLLSSLQPYALYHARKYPGLAAVFPNRAAVQKALARIKLAEYRANHPRLEARYAYYLSHDARISVPEMASALTRDGVFVSESQVYREHSALHLEISAALDRLSTEAERTALGFPAGPTSISTREIVLAAHGADVEVGTIAQAVGMSEARLSFFLHRERATPREVPWDRAVVDEAGVRSTEAELLRRLSAADPRLTGAEIATALNVARARALGGSVITPGSDEFRTYVSTQAKRRALGLAATIEAPVQDVYRTGFGAVIAGGQLRAPEALEYIRAQRAAEIDDGRIAKDLGITTTALREFERKYSEDSTTGLPSVLRPLLDEPGTLARNTEAIARFFLDHQDKKGGGIPRQRSVPRTENETMLARQLKHLKTKPEADRLAMLRESNAYKGAAQHQQEALVAMFTDKRIKSDVHVDNIVRFFLAHETHADGPSPRAYPSNPRTPNESALGLSLNAIKNKSEASRRALLNASEAYRSASEAQRNALDALFLEKRWKFEESVRRIVQFALLHGTPTTGQHANRTPDEERLARTLGEIKKAKTPEVIANALNREEGYVGASQAQREAIDALFLGRRRTFAESIDGIVRFYLEHENDSEGGKPRMQAKTPRSDDELSLGLAIQSAKQKHSVQERLAALRANERFQQATDDQRAAIERMMTTKRGGEEK